MNKRTSVRKTSRSSHKAFYQSMGYVLLSVVVACLMVYMPGLRELIQSLGDLGYIGAFIAGMLFVSIFTAAPAAVILFTLSSSYPILPVALVAGMGAVIGDSVIMYILASRGKEIEIFLPKKQGIIKSIEVLRHSKYKFVLSFLGAIIVASPLPDEIGLSLMGVGSLPWYIQMIMTFILNTVGIYILLLLL